MGQRYLRTAQEHRCVEATVIWRICVLLVSGELVTRFRAGSELTGLQLWTVTIERSKSTKSSQRQRRVRRPMFIDVFDECCALYSQIALINSQITLHLTPPPPPTRRPHKAEAGSRLRIWLRNADT